MNTVMQHPSVYFSVTSQYYATHVMLEKAEGIGAHHSFTFYEIKEWAHSNYPKVVSLSPSATDMLVGGNLIPIMEAWQLYCNENEHVNCDEWEIFSDEEGRLVLNTGDWIVQLYGKDHTFIQHPNKLNECVPYRRNASYPIADVDDVPRGIMHNVPDIEYSVLLKPEACAPFDVWKFLRAECFGNALYGEKPQDCHIVIKISGRFTYDTIWNTLDSANLPHVFEREGVHYFSANVSFVYLASSVYDSAQESLERPTFFGQAAMVSTDEQAETKIQQLIQDIMNTTPSQEVATEVTTEVADTQSLAADVVFVAPDESPAHEAATDVTTQFAALPDLPQVDFTVEGTIGTAPALDVAAITAAANAEVSVVLAHQAQMTTTGTSFSVPVSEVVHESSDMIVGAHGVNVSELLTHGVGARAPKKNLPREKRRNDAQDGAQPRTQQAQQRPRPTRPQVPTLLQSQSPLAAQFLENIKVPAESVDGVGHMNVGSSAKTALGRFLDFNAQAPFEYGNLGRFNSLGGLWVFICIDEEERAKQIEAIRMLHGTRARHWARNCTKQVPGFKVIMADATMFKILSNEQRCNELIESTLPMRMYHTNSDDGQTVGLNVNAAWYVPVLEEIRRTLVARKQSGDDTIQPDFSFLIHDGGASDYARRNNSNRNRPNDSKPKARRN